MIKKSLIVFIFSIIIVYSSYAALDPRMQRGQTTATTENKQKLMYVDINRIIPKEQSPSAKDVFLNENTIPAQAKESNHPKLTKAFIQSEVNNTFSKNSLKWKDISKDQKIAMIKDIIDTYISENVKIKGSVQKYVDIIDNMTKQTPSMLNNPLDQILKVTAIIEYDFDDGTNKDLLGERILGKEAWKRNKQRLGK